MSAQGYRNTPLYVVEERYRNIHKLLAFRQNARLLFFFNSRPFFIFIF